MTAGMASCLLGLTGNISECTLASFWYGLFFLLIPLLTMSMCTPFGWFAVLFLLMTAACADSTMPDPRIAGEVLVSDKGWSWSP
jgi:CDP-diglyceride synthetase